MSTSDQAEYESYIREAARRLETRMRAKDCPKEKLDSFEVLGRLGKGFSGSVFEARHRSESIHALKVLPKHSFNEETFKSHGLLEKEISYALDSPFIVKLFYAFQDVQNLYLVMEYAAFGDLKFAFESNTESSTERLMKLFAAQVVLALEYLHACQYAYYDLKLANVLLFEDGYLKLCDLGFVKKVDEELFFLYGQDWWDLGKTLTTLLLGRPPRLRGRNGEIDTYFDITDHEPDFPKFFLSNEVKDFLARLLRQDRERQLGGSTNGAEEVKNHRWFRDIDFLGVFHKKVPMTTMLPRDLRLRPVREQTEIPRSLEPIPDQKLFADF